MPVTEGTVPYRGHRTWYQRVDGPGSAGKVPLLVLHGGPGFPHDYLEDLARLADGDDGRPVVFYDQLGCGKSDRPADDPALWTLATFVGELAAVREALGLERVHLFGHSWGAMLALQYALDRPAPGLASLTLAGGCASAPLYAAEARRLYDSLPAGVRGTIERHEAQGTTDSEEYTGATTEFYSRWLCRLDPYPDHLMRSFTRLSEDVYGTMLGTEWNVSGNLKDWDVTARLGELDLPVLVTSGRHDEMTPAAVRPLADGIAGAEWVVFEESAHFTTAEEPEHYRQVLAAFLARAEGSA
ncbi:proline iminopeptidase-family hydrolase [Streptomyces sp. NPDC091371]|uniref:proline iminopeptidase-family hydrolase n=1 Tax=Streptomyces sp. NPDC091371 TaxID=3155303 RepID=UPI0034266925